MAIASSEMVSVGNGLGIRGYLSEGERVVRKRNPICLALSLCLVLHWQLIPANGQIVMTAGVGSKDTSQQANHQVMEALDQNSGQDSMQRDILSNCGNVVITQNLDPNTVTEGSVKCPVGDNSWARCFTGSEFPADFLLQCVDFGVFLTGGGANVDLRISIDSDGCPPAGMFTTFQSPPASFIVLHSQIVTIPTPFIGIVQVSLGTPIAIPAGFSVIIEVHDPTSLDQNNGVNFNAGSNEAGATGSSFFWTPVCVGGGAYGPISVPGNSFDFVVRLNGTFFANNDCNGNGIQDICDIGCGIHGGVCAVPGCGSSLDCNNNAIPDECESDCNGNGIPDDCDITAGISQDCNSNSVPDECDIDPTDPDGNGQISSDCRSDGIPDECQLSFAYLLDDGVAETSVGLQNGGNVAWMNHFNIVAGSETLIRTDLAWGTVANGTPATVYLWSDPNGDGNPSDAVVLTSASTTVQNANMNILNRIDFPSITVGPAGTSFFVGAIVTHQSGEKPTSLDTTNPAAQSWLVADGANPIDPNNLAAAAIPPFKVTNGSNALVRAIVTHDCNTNGTPDACEIDMNSTAPGGPFFCTANCDPDCNNNGIPDACDIANCPGDPACGDCNNNGIPDSCDIASLLSNDVVDNMTGLALSGGDGIPDECISWNDGAPNTLWTSPTNWDAGVVPGVGNPANVESPDINLTNTIVDLDINASVDSLVLGVDSTLNISMADLTLDSPNGIRNEGIFNINDGFSVLAGSATRIIGSQPIQLMGPTATISSVAAGDAITNQGTISGQGIIDAELVNQGTIQADSTGNTLSVQGTMTKTNDGAFRAIGGATLLVTDTTVTGSGSYSATGGTIQVLPGAGGASIAGATMDVRGGGLTAPGVVEVAGAVAVTLTGAVTVGDGGTYRGLAGTSSVLTADSAALTTGPGLRGGQMLISGNMRLSLANVITIDGTDFPCGPTPCCTPPILNLTGGGLVDGASMDVLAGRVALSGGSLTITDPSGMAGRLLVDAGGEVAGDSPNPADTLTADSISLQSNVIGAQSQIGGQLRVGGNMGLMISGNFEVVGCGPAPCCTPPILSLAASASASVGGHFSIAGRSQVDVTTNQPVLLSGNFDNRSIDPTIFNWAAGSLTMNGTAQTFELAGENRGVSAAGFVDNFAMGTLRVEAGSTVNFVDAFENIPGAGCEVLYVDTLSLGLGATIRLNGCYIFYRNLVDEGATVDPVGGGALVCFNPGDVNCDGLIDMNDTASIVNTLLNPSANPADTAASDLNGDGMTNGLDIQMLVNILLGL